MSRQDTLAPILVVDDNEPARYVKAHILRGAGFEILEAAGGYEALRLVATHKPRLVVLDVHLPDVNGWEVCRRLKQDPATASVLVLQVSATFVSEGDTVRALEGGADGCLTEPIEAPVLVATVRALLRAREAEDSLREALAREQQARSSAENANRAKDEFLALLSHELRSPLGTILTWVTLLRDPQADAVSLARGLETIERNARLQVKMIEDLLDVSRIVAGKTRLELQVVQLSQLLDVALESVAPIAAAKSIRIDSFVDPELGPLLGDAGRLQQILWNLLSNAVKFTPKGGQAEIRVEKAGSQARICVSDNGTGIDAAFLPYIFDRFRQADSSTTRVEGGLGLGLAIVRHLVELHGGRVEAESAGIGQGATFTVWLPMATLRDAPKSIEPASAPNLEASSSVLEGVRVLVVDDEPDAREAIGAALQNAGATVASAGSVREAIATVGRGVPDVIVSDIAMPVEDGFTLIRELRAGLSDVARGVRALALSAYVGEHAEARICEAGFDAHLSKPIEASKLILGVAALARSPR